MGFENSHKLSYFGALRRVDELRRLALRMLEPCGRPGRIKLFTSRPNITKVIDYLETQGLVKRERSDDDRRHVIVRLTSEGTRLIKRLFPFQLERIREEMSVLEPKEQLEFARLCRKLGRRDGTAP